MTYKMKLIEMFPKADLSVIERIIKFTCCEALFNGVKRCPKGTCTECWYRKVKEDGKQ